MENLLTEIGPAATTLVGVVAMLVQQLKRFPFILAMKDKAPIFSIASLAFGIGGAHLLGLANPIFAGVIVGLAAGGAFDTVKKINGTSVKGK